MMQLLLMTGRKGGGEGGIATMMLRAGWFRW